jgi:hypothetical protein
MQISLAGFVLVLVGESDEVELHGIAMDTVSTFAEAVGKDAFRPYPYYCSQTCVP